MTNDTSLSPTALLAQANHLLYANRLVEAETLFWQVLRDYPHNLEALHALGFMALKRGQAEAALSLLEQALAAARSAPDAAALASRQGTILANCGQALQQLGRLKEAVHYWRQGLLVCPSLPNVADWLQAAEKTLSASTGKAIARPVKDHAPARKAQGRTSVAPLVSRPALPSIRLLGRSPRASADKPIIQVDHQRLNIEQALQLGLEWLRSGQFEPALALHRLILKIAPSATAWHQLSGIHFNQGNLAEAARCLRRALELDRSRAACHNDLGTVLNSLDKIDEAVACFRQAVALDPNYAEAHANLGVVLDRLDCRAEAEACYRRAIQLKPDHSEAHYNLGNNLQSRQRLEEAVASYQQTLTLHPDHASAHNNLGVALAKQDRHAEALACYQQAIALKADYAEAHNNLGNSLQELKRYEEAIACYRQALAFKPDYAEAHCNMAIALNKALRIDEAYAAFRQAIALNPDYIEAYFQWGSALRKQRRLLEALDQFREALRRKPDTLAAMIGMAEIFQLQGLHDEALAVFRQAWDSAPDSIAAAQNVLFQLNYMPDLSPQAVFAEHLEFAKQFEAPLRADWRPHDNEREPQRKLRIGYVSGDFRRHVVAFFIEPVLVHHDRESFEITCYANYPEEDAVTERLKTQADRWRNIAKLTDESAAEQIRADQIDILVDLAGHSGYNRLMVFARKPAPVQVTWLGYNNTTGLQAMDYRLVDRHTDPPELGVLNSETLYPLPEIYAVFQPPPDGPEVAPAPVLTHGYITFGSFNNFAKVTERVIAVWARLLHAVPDSRLLLKTAGLNETEQKQRIQALFAAQGITTERLILLGQDPSDQQHRARYHQVDIALDPFPYNGTTTTCEALWMGVPVVALAGNRSGARSGVSILRNVGLDDLVARDQDDYVAIAARLASQPERLATLRAGMRDRLAASPLWDAERFTHHLENAYCTLWQAWCAHPNAGFSRLPS